MKILLSFLFSIISMHICAQENAYYENLIPELNGKRELSFHFQLKNVSNNNEILQVAKDWFMHDFRDQILHHKQINPNTIQVTAYFGIHLKKLVKLAGSTIQYNMTVSAREQEYIITFSDIKLENDHLEVIQKSKNEKTFSDLVNDCYSEKKLDNLNNCRVAVQIIYDRFKQQAGLLREAELNYANTIKNP